MHEGLFYSRKRVPTRGVAGTGDCESDGEGRGRTQQSMSRSRGRGAAGAGGDGPQDGELAAYSWNTSHCVSLCVSVLPETRQDTGRRSSA